MRTFTAIIDALGYADLAKALGVSPKTTFSWKTRNRLPSQHWRAVSDLARDRGVNGIDLDAIATIAATRPAPAQTEAA